MIPLIRKNASQLEDPPDGVSPNFLVVDKRLIAE